MQFRQLGDSNIQVSVLCLGTMTWGQQNTEKDAHEQLDCAIDAGINFIDCAEMYPVPPRAETQGLSETFIGSWLGKRKTQRDKLIIATKVAARADWIPYLRNGNARLDKDNINTAVNESLRRLDCDYIDLYQVHWPERDANYFGQLNYYHAPEKDGTPIAETMSALSDLVKEGKIRHIGISNETPWGMSEYLRQSTAGSAPRIVSIQNPYSLLNRSFEIGLAEMSHRENAGLLAYSPLGFGTLTGKYLHNKMPENSRLSMFGERYNRYSKEQGVRATEKYVQLALDSNIDPTHMALAFVNSRPFLTSTILGATTMQQLRHNIKSIDVELDKEILREIEKINAEVPLPCP